MSKIDNLVAEKSKLSRQTELDENICNIFSQNGFIAEDDDLFFDASQNISREETPNPFKRLKRSSRRISLYSPGANFQITDNKEGENNCDEKATLKEYRDEHQFLNANKYTSTKPLKSTKPLTVPQEFNFILATRNRTRHRMTLRPRKSIKVGLEKMKPEKKKAKVTSPKPFRLNLAGKPKPQPMNSPYVPLAERLKKEFDDQIDRTLRKNWTTTVKNNGQDLTVPKSPLLLTKSRIKPISNSSELEEEIIQSIKPFKANPVDPRVLNSAGDYGVPKIKKCKPTEAMFATDERLKMHHEKENVSKENLSEFKANPVPVEIFERIVGVPAKKQIPLTEPKSPAITKIVKEAKCDDMVPKKKRKRAHSFDGTLPGDFIMMQKKEKFKRLIEQQKEEERKLSEFKAQPLPPLEPGLLPKVAKKSPTIPVPFSLSDSVRRKEQVLEDGHDEYQFKANPLPPDTVFIPKKSTKPLTQAEDILLQTEVRCQERRLFDDHVKQVKQQEEQMQKEKEIEMQEEQVREMRKKLVHKAQPIRKYSQIKIKPSSKVLTEPKSPSIKKSAMK
ncbi:TPX2 domain-containing protein [Rozella allomycis CSF55]|uniref:TPX2 domain-containing protein n=1 Tax=Rozella allomycis (strain CSF55) TaxID=988480 RepID=A0A075AVY0_ROZAC|nr:TPX2 domain-containing protein [Rozella allomycis CSF55]|eukprot:EPZ34420.1 TPX2 domain-containing protein [Rozella allomycis CSF55]